MNPKPFRIIPCAEWKALAPKSYISHAGKPSRIIFHHTAGHHPELDGKQDTVSYEESCAYARSIQNYHMGHNGWNDSGHNFLVTRGGFILEGRHGSLSAVQSGKMVVSAHCPGQNDQPGVEHEHLGSEPMTPIQYQAALWLATWICRHCAVDPKQIKGHRDYFATSCPGSLYALLPKLRKDVAVALKPPKSLPKPKPPPGYWQVTKTFYDGNTKTEKTSALRLWALRQGNLIKKGVRDVRAHWIETG
jgi:hypothetical protein